MVPRETDPLSGLDLLGLVLLAVMGLGALRMAWVIFATAAQFLLGLPA